MPRNGSGTFSLAEPAFVAGNTISSTDVNTVLSDIATALTGSLAADGQKTASANQPMGGNKHTGVGDATNRTDYAAAGQIANGQLTWAGVAGGTADALTLSLNPVITAYVTGMKIRFQAGASANTGATTVNVNSVGAKAVELNDAALTGGEIVANKYYEILYDGTAFQLTQLSVAVDPDILKADTSDNLTVGFTCDVYDYGNTGTTTQTITLTDEALQTMGITGSFTLAPPASGNGVAVIIATTDATGGYTVTTSGFTRVNGTYDNTADKVHRFTVTKVESTTILDIDEVA